MPQNALDREDFNTGVPCNTFGMVSGGYMPTPYATSDLTGQQQKNRTAIQIRQQFMKYFTEENPAKVAMGETWTLKRP
ncbi:hypothetical protein TNCV_3465281 [Trichonephila clavipes]|nr:hypothetical protein TNCV_3465281 [Trichonephila clavipes]